MPGFDAQHTENLPRRRTYPSLHSSHQADQDNARSFMPFNTSNPTQHAVRSPSPLHILSPPPPTSRPTTTSRLHDRDFSRTLPPLIFGPPPDRANYPTPGINNFPSAFSRSTVTPSYPLQRSSSPESTFAHYPPEPTPRSPVVLPPPFAMQPTPRWQSSSYRETWSRPGSDSAKKSITPPIRALENERNQGESSTAHIDATPRPRSGRYDPVRSTFIHMIPAPAELSPPPKPSGEGERLDSDDGHADTT